MGKRKKKLLFDVLDDVVAERQRTVGRTRRPPSPRAKSARTPPGKSGGRTKAAGPAEIRITRDMAITIVVVMLAFIGCSYYSGLVHGRSSAGEDDAVSLRRSAGDEGDRSTWGEHFAIQACSEGYNPYTLDALRETMRDLALFLKDRGYSHIDVYDYPHATEEGLGTLIMWVGRAGTRRDLEADATELRSLRLDGSHPFATAFVTLFSD